MVLKRIVFLQLGLAMLLVVSLSLRSVGQMSMEQAMAQPLPLDQKVRIGRLENGMTYYIRANAEPKERAEFYILHNVGAIMEEDDQQGLAHFTEHMAFNGTKHFPGKKLIGFLERNGVKFGADLNAFTNHDITCYNISDVPTRDAALMDSCVLVLSDWSGSISMDGEEIDKERGVIAEEWRTRRNAAWRSRDARNPVVFKGSKYAERDVIGPLQLLKTFEHSKIRDFYHKWYRPDMQAIIIVGDFDVDAMEARVQRIAGAIAKPAQFASRPSYPVPPTEGIAYVKHVDAETQMARVEFYYQHPVVPAERRNMGYYRDQLVQELMEAMLNARFEELVQRPESPLVASFARRVSMIRPVDHFLAIAVPKPGLLRQALKSLITETQRASQKGFTAGELDRAKADMLRGVQKRFDERNKMANSAYIFTYINHYTLGEPMPGIEVEAQLQPALMQTITLEDVNAKLRSMVGSKDLVIFFSTSEAEAAQIPSQEEVASLYNKIYDSQLEAWVDNTRNEPLIAQLPQPGAVKSEKVNNLFGSHELVLSNGVRVIVKTTDFKQDEVGMYAFAPGGTTLVSEDEVPSASVAGGIVSESGLGAFDATELRKMSAGKDVSLGAGLSSTEAYLVGSSSVKPEELEFWFQQMHLYFTKPRFDEQAAEAMLKRMESMLGNADKDPNRVFARRLVMEIAQGAKRFRPMSLETIKEVQFEKAKAAYMEQFSNAQNFTFIFVGNVDVATLKPLLVQYLGSLPAGKKLSKRDHKVRFPEKPRTLTFGMQMETPKTRFAKVYNGSAKYTLANQVMVEAIEHVLSLRYTEEIREKEGGTYGVGVRGSLRDWPVPEVRMQMAFDTDPEKADKLIPLVTSVFEDLFGEVADEDVDKAKKHFLKAHAEDVRDNGYWLRILEVYAQNGVDLHTNYEKEVNKLTATSVRKRMTELFGKSSYVQVEMQGAKL